MDQQSQLTTKQKSPFILNKTKVNELGFNLSSDQKYLIACPFQSDTSKAHPTNAKYPQGFCTLQFNFDKVASKLNQQAMFYIFYNVMDQRLQMFAGRTLMKSVFRYNKHDKIWVRKVQGKFQYFNIVQWKFVQYTGNKSGDNFCTETDFAQR